MSLLLRVGHGVELTGGVPAGWLPPGLGEQSGRELAEWHALAPAGGAAAHDVLRARAEQLAARVAAETSTVVLVVAGDEVLRFGAPEHPDRAAPAEAADRPGSGDEPTPWGTGLALAAAAAVLSLVAFLALYTGLAAISVLLAVGVLAVVVVLLVPTGLRHRVVPVWRWVVHGAAAGVALGWVGVLLSALT